MSFYLGQKVVCIKRGPWKLLAGKDQDRPKPKFREICTVAEMVREADKLCLGLAEYEGDYFAARNFRPVQKRKTDISIFTSLLTPTKAKERA